jgi:hypothetical protein
LVAGNSEGTAEVELGTAERAEVAPVRGVLADREPDFVSARARTIADLPEEGKRSNIIALAVSLQLFGLSDDEIAMQMRADPIAVRGLLSSQSASTVRDAIVDSVSRRYEPKVRSILNEASVDAAKVVVSSIHNGSPGHRLRAASSVLDRTGHAAVNNVEHSVNGGLVIEVIQRVSAVPDIVVDGI